MYCGVPKKRAAFSAYWPKASSPKAPWRVGWGSCALVQSERKAQADGKNAAFCGVFARESRPSNKETHMVRKLRPSPALVVASLALFFAIGGSAFAVVGRTEAAQPRCSPGAVRGIAYVTGDPKKGMRNLPDTFASAANLFGYRWNCSGGAIAVRKNGNGFDVKFGDNASTLGYGERRRSRRRRGLR